jgi:hypothetical protein
VRVCFSASASLSLSLCDDGQSERLRISELGGIVSEIGGVFRVNGSLAVTRAFGDSKCVPWRTRGRPAAHMLTHSTVPVWAGRRHKKYVTAEPDVIQFRLDGTQDYLVRPTLLFLTHIHAQCKDMHTHTLSLFHR